MTARYLKSFKGLTISFLTVLFVSLIISGLANISHATSLVEFSNDKLTVKAENDSMVKLLEKIAKKTNIVIFVSKDFNPGNVSINLNKVQLDSAFKKLLKNHNFVTIYNKQKDQFVISALKIYPKGKNAGQMDVLITESKSVEHTQTGQNSYRPVIPGTTLPGEYVKYAATKDKSLIHVGYGFEQVEKRASKKINELREKISQTHQEEQQGLLTLELIDSLVKFEAMQRDHVNALESLYRIALFKKNTKGGTD